MALLAQGSTFPFSAGTDGATVTLSVNGGCVASWSGAVSGVIGPVPGRIVVGPLNIGQSVVFSADIGSCMLEFGDATPNEFGNATNAVIDSQGRLLGAGGVVLDVAAAQALTDGVVVPSGAADYSPILLSALTAGGSIKVTPADYSLSTNVIAPAGDVSFYVDPDAAFPGAGKIRLGNLIPYIPQPVLSLDLYSKTYGTEWNGYKNIFQQASYAKANVARGGASIGPAVVAILGHGEAVTTGAAAWGLNVNGVASADGATAIAVEVDSQAATAASVAVNTLLVAVGAFPSEVALQIQSNTVEASFKNGIFFNNRVAGAINGTYPIGTDIPAVTGSYIKADAGVAERGIEFAATTFTASEWESSNFVIGPTVTLSAGEYRSGVRLDGSKTGNPSIGASGGDGTAPVNLTVYARNGGNIAFATSSKSGPVNFQVKHTENADTYPRVSGSVSGDVTLDITGSATNSSVSITGKGTGGGKMRDGAGAIKFQWNTTGVGFHAASPVAKQTVTGSRGGNAAVADLIAKLALTGLISDGTTA